MRRLLLLVMSILLTINLTAQDFGQEFTVLEHEQFKSIQPPLKFKPHYAGSSLDAGFMIMPSFGTGFYVAPKFTFQVTPRLFVKTGIGVVQYSLMPSQMKYEGASKQTTATGAYILTEGIYLLNEQWSVNGSAFKNITPQPMRNITPYRIPNEAFNFGVDYKITPNLTVGAKVGYSN